MKPDTIETPEVPLPRGFKLLKEYDAATGKEGLTYLSQRHQSYITYGWKESDELTECQLLHHWGGMIIGVQGKQTGEIMYQFTVYVPDDYPKVPPQLRFIAPRVAMSCVRANGTVDISKINPPFHWHNHYNIADLLMAVRENMYDDRVCQESAKLAGTRYS